MEALINDNVQLLLNDIIGIGNAGVVSVALREAAHLPFSDRVRIATQIEKEFNNVKYDITTWGPDVVCAELKDDFAKAAEEGRQSMMVSRTLARFIVDTKGDDADLFARMLTACTLELNNNPTADEMCTAAMHSIHAWHRLKKLRASALMGFSYINL